jgi:hypothetical protein
MAISASKIMNLNKKLKNSGAYPMTGRKLAQDENALIGMVCRKNSSPHTDRTGPGAILDPF